MTITKEDTLTCANHPNRETLLRCNRCEKPICVECAVLTPTGYRCKQCVRSQQKIFDTATPIDFVFGILIAGILSYLGSLLAGMFGFFVFLVAPAAGWVISEAVRRATKRRRSKLLFQLIAAATAIGGLLNLLPILLLLLLGDFSFGYLLSAAFPALYAFLVTSTVYYRLSGIQIK
jgi:hypothetical protein